MSALPSFTIAGPLNEVVSALTGGELTEAAMQSATVTFTPNVGRGNFVTWESRLESVPPVVATVAADGTLQYAGGTLKLLANDPGLNVTGLRWSVVVRAGSQRFRSWSFLAPNDNATLALAATVPSPLMTDAGVDGGSPGSSGGAVIDGGSP